MQVSEALFYKIIQDTWTSTLGFQVDRTTSTQLRDGGKFIVGVKITGVWDGEICLHCYFPLARLIAAVIFQIDATETRGEEIFDALGELVHIIGGNFKALLPQPVVLSLPAYLSRGDWAQTRLKGQVMCELSLQREGHPFSVTLRENHTTHGRRENTSRLV